MNETAEPASDVSDGEPDQISQDGWPERPRLVTARGCLVAIAIMIFGFAMALGILRSRQMEAERTQAFFGDSNANIIRLGKPVEMIRSDGSQASEYLERYNEGWIDLSELRDIGYFRRVFLDDNHYEWQSQTERKVPAASPSALPWSFIRFGEQPGLESFTLAFHLDEGWVGEAEGGEVVQLQDRVRRKIAHRIRLFSKLEQPDP